MSEVVASDSKNPEVDAELSECLNKNQDVIYREQITPEENITTIPSYKAPRKQYRHSDITPQTLEVEDAKDCLNADSDSIKIVKTGDIHDQASPELKGTDPLDTHTGIMRNDE